MPTDMMKFNLWVLSQGLQRDLRWGFSVGKFWVGNFMVSWPFAHIFRICVLKMVSENRGKTLKMDDLLWKSLLKWMIWGYHHFQKHPYKSNFGIPGSWNFQAPMDDAEDEGVEAPGWVGASSSKQHDQQYLINWDTHFVGRVFIYTLYRYRY